MKKFKRYSYIICDCDSNEPLFCVYTDYDRATMRYLINEVRRINGYSTEDLKEMFEKEDIDWEDYPFDDTFEF